MNKQIIREALLHAQDFIAVHHSPKGSIRMRKALAELDAPAPQSARDLAIDFIQTFITREIDFPIKLLASKIEAYADSKVQEALGVAKMERKESAK